MPSPSRFSTSRPRHGLADERLRCERFSMVATRAGVTSAASVATCVLVVATFWQRASHAYLLMLLATLLILQSLSLLGARTWLAGERRVASPRRLRVHVGVYAAIAAAWASAPMTLMPAAGPNGGQLLIYISAGLMSWSVALAPLLPAAMLFNIIATLGALLPIMLIHESATTSHAALVLMYGAMTTWVVLGQNRDFDRRVRNELTLGEQSELIGLLLRDFEENASDFLWETDALLRLHRVPPRLMQIMGCAPAALHGVSLPHWVTRSGATEDPHQHSGPTLLACLDSLKPFRDLRITLTFEGEQRWLTLSGKPVLDAAGKFLGYRGVGSDVTAAHNSNEKIAYLARYDGLTGLPNRMLFQDALGRACAHDAPFALMCLDLDGFKAVNDRLGHGVGDALLVAVAGRLRSCLREGDIAARLGGDEFAVLQVGADAAGAAVLAQRLIDRVAEPYQIGEVSVSVGLSVGVALSRDAGPAAEDLLRGADLALYHSKSQGRGLWHSFEPDMALRANERHILVLELRRAIEQGELTLDYQPIVDLASGIVTGAEALVRWLHPVRGRIPPADFIPAAEESGLIVALGEWVLRRACLEAASWGGRTRVAVNLSPLQFRDPGLLALVDQVLAETGLSPQRLELEITESVFLDGQESTIACLNALRERGIPIALDDFGTGYSSLSYLRTFPFDRVKIDKSFIRDLGVDNEADAIIRAIVSMASSLGMRTTGEGVETQSQADLLHLTGCGQVQGYLFGRPCAPEAIGSFMKADQPPVSQPGSGKLPSRAGQARINRTETLALHHP